MDLLPLGTVIQVDEYMAFIIGYSSVEKNHATSTGYFIVSYPLGFTSIDKVVFMPHDYKFSIVAEGYKTVASAKLLKVLSTSLDSAKHISIEDIVKLNHFLSKSVHSKKEEMAE